MGATLTANGCNFRVWAPNASRVWVMGDFNGWRDDQHEMVAEGEGVWAVQVTGVRAGAEYLYVVDNRGGDEWNPGQRGLRRIDPWARATRGSGGNGVVVDVLGELEATGLARDPFVTPASADWIIYQVHVGSFVGGGDEVDTGANATGTFAQFERKLPYVRSLGFNAIALLPVHQNPGDGNEGYGPSHLFAPESSYGSPAELRHLVRAAHDIGLAVIFDVVWNHMSDFDNRLWDFDGMTRDGGIFFEGSERSPWGPRLATWKSEVRDMIVANARMCFAEYHVDGLRVDAADEIPRDVLAQVVQSVRADEACRGKLLIAEWTAGESAAVPDLLDDVGFDRIWALGDPHVFLAAVTAASAARRTERLVELIDLPDGARRVRYLLGSHDTGHDNESGGRTGFRHFIELAGGRESEVARAKARMGWVLCAALPGTPMCFMGAECLQPGYWHPRTDRNMLHADHRFDWSGCADGIGGEMRALVGLANELRWNHLALRRGRTQLLHVDAASGVIAFRREIDHAAAILVVVNASPASWTAGGYRLPINEDDRSWRLVLDSRGGAGGEDLCVPRDGELNVAVPAWSVTVYRG